MVQCTVHLLNVHMSRAVEFTWAEETLGGVIFSETSPWIPDHGGFAACVSSEYVTFQIFSLPSHGGQGLTFSFWHYSPSTYV